MQVSFLSARAPLTKYFELDSTHALCKHSYPHVLRFTSHTYTITTLTDFARRLKAHAHQHHCLLKGVLNTPLAEQSRAQSTDPDTPTKWLCLDIDGLRDVARPSVLIKALPPCFHNVAHIVQYSCSMGMDPDKGLSAHLFFLLDQPTTPATLKHWLTTLNLDTPLLRENLTLSRTHIVLKYPLDISVVGNDKLIYIAPPLLGAGLTDPLQQRIRVISGQRARLALPGTTCKPQDLRHEVTSELNRLRKQAGLPPRKHIDEKTLQGVCVARQPDQAQVTGTKTEREFTYLNLNDGDSWGYYHPTDNPTILYNFKGEPFYSTRELLPAYYAQATAAAEQAADTPRVDGDITYLAFLEPRSSTYYRGTWNSTTQRHELHAARNVKMVNDFLSGHGQPKIKDIPEWHLEFNFGDRRLFSADERYINRYQPSVYLARAHQAQIAPSPTTGLAQLPHTTKVIAHALGSAPQAVEHFLNWLACIFQHRTKVGTAWLLSGTQGTGKGLLFGKIIRPLVGQAYCPHTSLRTFDREFSGFLEDALFVLVDEVEMTRLNRESATLTRLKSIITEPDVDIRHMYASEVTTPNFSHFIFTSNSKTALDIVACDRRFHISPRQETPLVITEREVNALANELQGFANYLLTRPADLKQARTPLDNAARRQLQALTSDSGQAVADAIKHGDFQFLWDNRPDIEDPGTLALRTATTALPTYKDALRQIIDYRDGPHGAKISRAALQTIYYYITGLTFLTPHKFTKFLQHKGLFLEQMRFGEDRAFGLRVAEWHLSKVLDKEFQAWLCPARPKLRVIKDDHTRP